MKNKSLIYGIVGLLAGSALTGLLLINRTQAQTQLGEQNSQIQKPQYDRRSPETSRSANRLAMGMMDREQADRHFIQMMIPHHEGAVDMANLALNQAKRPEIKQLAEAIKRDQNREIEQMKTWYQQWYSAEVPAVSGMGMSMHSGMGMGQRGNGEMPMHSGMGMMGMADTDLEMLKNADDFDRVFIEQMIPHHKMAVMMAAMILDSDRPEMRELAKNIIDSQTAEIQQMQQWHQTWYR
ncbi:MAG TPA: DUF305 domain-containing protein [Cyanobacteria bacterium UBA9273]|nr:DUF305 domain-containing protein [Cyanobacteria bacterium UBA9273]